jgi:hypothetical protein
MTLGLVLVMACVMGAGLVVVGVLRLGALAPAWKNAGIELAADNILVWMNINRGTAGRGADIGYPGLH